MLPTILISQDQILVDRGAVTCHELINCFDQLLLEIKINFAESAIDLLFDDGATASFFSELVDDCSLDYLADPVLQHHKFGRVHEIVEEYFFLLVYLVQSES